MDELKTRLRTLRENNKLTRKEISEKIQSSHDQIYNWENGRGEPDSAMLKKISETFGVTTDWLLGKVENPNQTKVEIHVDTCREAEDWNSLAARLSPEDKKAFWALMQSSVNRQTQHG